MIVPTHEELQTMTEPVLTPGLSGSPQASTLPYGSKKEWQKVARKERRRRKQQFGFGIR